MKRKSQIQSQVIVYILAVVILAMVLIFGYLAIQNMKDRACQAQRIRFNSDLKTDIETIGIDYGTSKTKTYKIGCGDYRQVCFVNLDHTNPDTGENDVLSDLDGASPIVKDNIKSIITGRAARKNMFLCPTCKDQDYVGNITLVNKDGEDVVYMCLPLSQGGFSLRITGLGDQAQLSPIR